MPSVLLTFDHVLEPSLTSLASAHFSVGTETFGDLEPFGTQNMKLIYPKTELFFLFEFAFSVESTSYRVLIRQCHLEGKHSARFCCSRTATSNERSMAQIDQLIPDVAETNPVGSE